jgi:putative transposase
MSRAGEVWKNSALENFFSSILAKRTVRNDYQTGEKERADVFDSIERFYNPRRWHSTLGHVSPVQLRGSSKSFGRRQLTRQQPKARP